MLSLTAVPNEAAPEADEFQSAAGPLAQTDFSALDAQVNIDKLLTRLYADLQAVEDAIQALEVISPERAIPTGPSPPVRTLCLSAMVPAFAEPDIHLPSPE